MKRLLTTTALLLAALTAHAQMVDGEVRKVDKAQGKVTLKHGELKNLDMPAMTMVFRVEDKAMLDRLQPGDKVKFTADKVNGQYVAKDIQPAK